MLNKSERQNSYQVINFSVENLYKTQGFYGLVERLTVIDEELENKNNFIKEINNEIDILDMLQSFKDKEELKYYLTLMAGATSLGMLNYVPEASAGLFVMLSTAGFIPLYFKNNKSLKEMYIKQEYTINNIFDLHYEKIEIENLINEKLLDYPLIEEKGPQKVRK